MLLMIAASKKPNNAVVELDVICSTELMVP
jgi:hypothetical protein